MAIQKEKSYMLAIPEDPADLMDLEAILDRLHNTNYFHLLDIQNEDGCLHVQLEYKKCIYQARFYPTAFELPALYKSNHLFKDLDIKKLEQAEEGIAVELLFSDHILDSYHLQLKLICTILPNIVGVLDDSSEKILSGRWARLAAESSVPPAPRYIFTAQAVSDEGSDIVWLHTHGLGRCGITELEIIHSTKEEYNNHYWVLETVANRLIDCEEQPQFKEPIYIGRLSEEDHLVCTLIPWEEAVALYDENMLGGKVDRKEYHNHNTAMIFVYCSEADYNEGIYRELQVYNELLADNPIFYLSNAETQRMKQLAQERIFFALNGHKNEENKVLLKIGLTVDEQYQDEENQKEHIWFDLLEHKENLVRAELTQQPYYVENMKAGDIGTYPITEITDWRIYTPQQVISPDDVYLLADLCD